MIPFSTHFKRSTTLLGILAILLSGLYFWFQHRIREVFPLQPSHTVLPRNIKEEILFDSNKHTITVVTNKGTSTHYSKHGSVYVTNAGDVLVHYKPISLELEPFVGYGYSDSFRFQLGTNFLQLWRFDLWGDVGFRTSPGPRLFEPGIGIGYNVWHNASLNVGVNIFSLLPAQQIEPVGFVSIKF